MKVVYALVTHFYYCLSSCSCFLGKNQSITFRAVGPRASIYFVPKHVDRFRFVPKKLQVYGFCEILLLFFVCTKFRIVYFAKIRWYCVQCRSNFCWYFASSKIRFFDFSMSSTKFHAILRIFANFREISNVECAKFRWEKSTNFVEICSHYFCTVLYNWGICMETFPQELVLDVWEYPFPVPDISSRQVSFLFFLIFIMFTGSLDLSVNPNCNNPELKEYRKKVLVGSVWGTRIACYISPVH